MPIKTVLLIKERFAEMKKHMGLASYQIFGEPGAWHVDHDGEAKNTYETKEAAFEAAIVAASLALRQGHEIIFKVPGSDGLQSATGAPSAG